MKKIVSLALILMMLVGVTVGCSDDASDTGSSGEEKITIGASLLTQSHPFQVAIKDAMEQEAEDQNVDLTVAIADQDLNRQISDIEDFINRGVDVIVLTPVDSDGIQGAIRKANDANIPVVTVDVKANDVEVASHIATDNYAGGMIAAEAMAQLVGEEGNVGLITYPEVQSVRDRIDGFKEVAAKYPNMNIVVELPGRTREEALTASQDMLTSNPDLVGIFGFGDDMAIAATNAVSEKDSDAVVVGFDGLEEARNKVSEDNAFDAVVVQYPEEMGSIGIQTAIKLANGEEVEKEIPITPGLFVEGQEFVDASVEDGNVNVDLGQ
ncbi:substrate-binding domain-containing protein [Clostridium sp. D2Q-11]|uniref:Substrate-binding domain-containing protein n=1 Tax=Anaeromonas frigoriresistens TaxID=2683708 RepID=A0A942UW17_9FIRM|nr:substrate-binding domain-containing protein [Anaeromonas frigoriresistens]MBS4537859.1 substrate-binding domain-containing protein [Anaeromonas frigoriresistens]